MSEAAGRKQEPKAGAAEALVLFLTLIACGVFSTIAVPPAHAADTLSREYDVKAVFLFHFAEFIDWPASALGAPGTPMTIGILGEDPFGDSLEQIVANETVKGRRITVRRCESPEQVDSCQIVFISPSERDHIGSIVNRVSRPGLLTVGDTGDFAKQSGVIEFVQSGSRLRLRINLAAAQAAGLTISSKLLRQAEIVRKEGARR